MREGRLLRFFESLEDVSHLLVVAPDLEEALDWREAIFAVGFDPVLVQRPTGGPDFPFGIKRNPQPM